MTQQITAPTAPFFTDQNGKALDLGFVWVGAENQDPQQNPIVVYWDESLTIAASQPLRTANGYIYRNGAPATVYHGAAAGVSMRVSDRNQRVIANVPSAGSIDGINLSGYLDSIRPMQSYTALRAYTGSATTVRITTPGIAGFFRKIASGVDNGGTVIVGALAWERIIEGDVSMLWFGHSGNILDDNTAAVQKTLDYLVSVGGGEISWIDTRMTAAVYCKGSNIRIKAGVGKKVVQSGSSYNTFVFYPQSLQGIFDGTSRPAGFANGIDGSPEALMYEADNANRLRNIRITGLDFEFTGVGAKGRFVDAFSVDRFEVSSCKAKSGHNVANVYYCRDFDISHNEFECISNTQFTLFAFKSYGLVFDNTLINPFNGVDAKGCYPQLGKTVLQAFDSGYSFYHPVKMIANKVVNPANYGLTSGYYDNSGADISATTTTGISKRDWYGETWGVEYTDNTVLYTGTPGINVSGIATNINSRYHKVKGNTLYGVGILSVASAGIKIEGNTIIKHLATNTAPIQLLGGTYGATSRNSTDCTVRGNKVFDGQSNRISIYLRGADYCTVEENKIVNSSALSNAIRVDSTASASTSISNKIINNEIRKTAADFAYPIISTGADGTVIDGNRAWGGWYNGNALDSDGFSDAHYKRGVVSAATPTSFVGAAGTASVGKNYGDQNTASPVAGYANEMAVSGSVGGGWRQAMRIGSDFLWIHGGKLYLKTGSKPTTSTDGTIVGTQT